MQQCNILFRSNLLLKNLCSWLGVCLSLIGHSCRSLVERCRQCDPQGSEESAQRANSSLDRIINHSVRVLTERLFEHIRVNDTAQNALSLAYLPAFFFNALLKLLIGISKLLVINIYLLTHKLHLVGQALSLYVLKT